MPPYASYFKNAQSVSDKWGLALGKNNEAEKVYGIWDLVYVAMKNTFRDSLRDDAQGFFTQKNTQSLDKYNSMEVVISPDQFRELVDLQRVTVLFKGFYLKQYGNTNFKWIWHSFKGRMGNNETAAVGMAKRFNDKYAPDELYHYVHYLMQTPEEPSSPKPVVVEQNGNFNLRAWYRKKSSKAVSLDQRA